MGVFYEQVELLNRTSKPLQVRFDGQDMEIPPNYTPEGERIEDVHTFIPAIAASHAKSQNVRNGTENPEDPSDYEVLVGIIAKKGEKQRDDLSYLEQDDEVLTRVNLREMLGDDPSVKEIRIAGKRNQPRTARHQAATPSGVDMSEFRRN